MERRLLKAIKEREEQQKYALLLERERYYETKSIEELKRYIGGVLSGTEHKAAYRAYMGKLEELKNKDEEE